MEPKKEDNYGGESVGKKLSRYVFWNKTRQWLGERFYKERHLILASREGGDISVLRGFGVPDANIVAVDRNKSAAISCKEKYPTVTIHNGEAGDIARMYKKELASAFLDFCSWPTDASIDTIFRVSANGLRNNSVLGYAFMRGRENTEVFSEMKELSIQEQKMITDFGKSLSSHINIPKGGRNGVPDGRSTYIYNRIQDRLTPLKAALFTLGRINYHSSCAWRKGVPMSIWVKWMHRNSVSSPSAFDRTCREISKDMRSVMLDLSAASLSNGRETNYATRYRDGEIHYPIEQSFDREFISMRKLLSAADEIEKLYPGEAHMMLNVSKGRLSAWRAHRTMGTYDKAA